MSVSSYPAHGHGAHHGHAHPRHQSSDFSISYSGTIHKERERPSSSPPPQQRQRRSSSSSSYTYTSYSGSTSRSSGRKMTNTVRASNKSAILAVGEELRLLLHDEDPPIIKGRRYHLRVYENCFVGHDMVDWLLKKGEVESRKEAVAMMQKLLDNGVIHHVCDDHLFKDEKLFYRFRKDDGTYEEPADSAIVAKGQRIYSRLKSDGSNLIQDRRYHLSSFKQCFVGRELVDWLLARGEASSRPEAIDLGRRLLEAGVFKHGSDADSDDDDDGNGGKRTANKKRSSKGADTTDGTKKKASKKQTKKRPREQLDGAGAVKKPPKKKQKAEGKIIQIVAYDDSNSEKAGSQSIVADDVEPGQSEHQTQQSSPAVVSQKKECGEHEQYPERRSTESVPDKETCGQDDAGDISNNCDGDNIDGGGDDNGNGRDKSAMSLDTITLEMEVQELIDGVTVLEQGHSSVLNVQKSILQKQEQILSRLAEVERQQRYLMYAHAQLPNGLDDYSFDNSFADFSFDDGPPAYIPPTPLHPLPSLHPPPSAQPPSLHQPPPAPAQQSLQPPPPPLCSHTHRQHNNPLHIVVHFGHSMHRILEPNFSQVERESICHHLQLIVPN